MKSETDQALPAQFRVRFVLQELQPIVHQGQNLGAFLVDGNRGGRLQRQPSGNKRQPEVQRLGGGYSRAQFK
jgi:hypothetical protein